MHRLVVFLMGLCAMAPAAMAQSRGELLYTTHCIACHTSQKHWRDPRAANDWGELKTQVRRWQGTAGLAWTDSDILDVARYLNDAFYRFEKTDEPVSTRSLGDGPLATALFATTAWRPMGEPSMPLPGCAARPISRHSPAQPRC